MPFAKTPSAFRPPDVPDRRLLSENRRLVREIDRRGVLRGAVSLGALSLLTGCDVSNGESVQSALRAISGFNDRVQAWLFDPNKPAPTYRPDQVLKPPRFNAYYPIQQVKPVDPATYQLEFAGLVSDKRPWTLDRIRAFPEQEIIVRHICIEGWDYIGQWSGLNLRDFLTSVGADLTAKYVAFHGNDDYMESIDMASALHPQTILATKYAGETLPDPYGFPLRLRTAVKLGFKNPKWIRAIEVTNTYPGGYWSDKGFNWFSGI
ncbi:molybdopterin-dependent oxidoreductase [Marinivivus vitaminiproducens]|uniref:molybdopterin-dependent oxidoreductase n=1 Tax=Marinivivus vitaminiproducens TaxID=3035935 RepID=UPI00279E064D|nr:molybdopterin-dependent oxidoreductase [Geminicoccaceae bacterium SCSIO 64248]